LREVFIIIFLITSFSYAQILEPKRLKIGASIGVGGLHTFGFPSLDFHKHNTSLRLAPGLFYYGAGISQKLFNYNGKIRNDRPIYANFYFLDDYLLSDLKNRSLNKPRTDLKLFMLIFCTRVPLNYLRTVYAEFGIGAMYAKETLSRFPGAPEMKTQILHHYLPMVEFRLGGTFLQRKYYKQKFKDPNKGWFKIRITILKKKKKKN
jgi:hypothetical protein